MSNEDQSRGREPDENEFESVLADCLDRMDLDQSFDLAAVLERHPSLAAELREFFDDAQFIAALAGPTAASETMRSTLPNNSSSMAFEKPLDLQEANLSFESGADPHALPKNFGRYRIFRLLGRGGMGSVYLAEDRELHRRVALKVPLLDKTQGPELVERFYREARSAARLHHRNICPVYDVGQIEGVRYLTMAFIDGPTLSGFEHDSPHATARIVQKLAMALAEAHSQGIIHRDLKPSNVMIDAKGEPIVMDFGLARVLTPDTDVALTQRGSIIGSPAYMSPEQIRGDCELVGPATDVYGLGVLFYELLAGRPPFEGDYVSVLSKVLYEQPLPPSSHRAGIPQALDEICLKMFAKRVEDRYGSMVEVATALQQVLESADSAIRAGHEWKEATGDRPVPLMKRRTTATRRWGITVGLLGAVMLGAAALKLATRDGEPARSINGPAPDTPSLPISSSTPAVVSIAPDYALKFDGEKGYAEGPVINFDGSGPFTVEARIVPASDRDGFLVAFGGSHGIGIRIERGTWAAFRRDGTSEQVVYAAVPCRPGVGVHLAAVADGARFELFVDGKRQPYAPIRNALIRRDHPLWIGGGQSIVPTIHGTIDEVRLSRGLRYRANFKPEGRHVADGETVALYHFDEGDGDEASDSSNATGNARIVHAEWVSADSDAVQLRSPVTSDHQLVEWGTEGDASQWDSWDYVLRKAMARYRQDHDMRLVGSSSVFAEIEPYGGGRTELIYPKSRDCNLNFDRTKHIVFWISAGKRADLEWQSFNPEITLYETFDRFVRLRARGEYLSDCPAPFKRYAGWRRMVVPLGGGAFWTQEGQPIGKINFVGIALDAYEFSPFWVHLDGLALTSEPDPAAGPRYDEFATGKWISLTDELLKAATPQVRRVAEGVELTSGEISFPNATGSNLIVRTKLAFTKNTRTAELFLRNAGGTDYRGVFSFKLGAVHIGKMVGEQWQELTGCSMAGYQPAEFELAFGAIGKHLMVFLDGQQVCQFDDPSYVDGCVGIKATKGTVLIKSLEVQHLPP